MYQFFIQPASVKEKEVWITDLQDVNHIRNVLRMKKGEKISLCCEEKGKEYICSIEDMQSDIVKAVIVDINGESRELPVKITLFQGLPKNDKMELIIQKAVELGVAEIVPMATKRAVVKLDAKKAAKKVQRWNEIAKSAAKQSKRGMIPEVKSVMSFKEAVEYGKSMDMLLIPYEDAEGIVHSRQVVESVKRVWEYILDRKVDFQRRRFLLLWKPVQNRLHLAIGFCVLKLPEWHYFLY